MKHLFALLLALLVAGCVAVRPTPAPPTQDACPAQLLALHSEFLETAASYNAWYNSPAREQATTQELAMHYLAEWHRMESLRLRLAGLDGSGECGRARDLYLSGVDCDQRALELALAYTATGDAAMRTRANENIDRAKALRTQALAILADLLHVTPDSIEL